MTPEWDVFVSYARQDVARVRPLVEALRREGLRVFVDEASIDVYERISARIRDGLTASKLLLAYYSAEYPRRPACQRELVVAFLAAMRQGEPSRRVLIVNPEADGSHIQPVELRDARWQTAPVNARERRAFAARVAKVAGSLVGPLGGAGGVEPARWVPGRRLGMARFVGRFGDLWRLHTGLLNAEFVERRTSAPVACVYGLGGVGKTTLVEQYALDFESAFPGGVVWLNASSDAINPDALGQTEARRRFLARYASDLRRVADSLGLTVRRMERERILALIADQLTARGRPCLWVIDDLPVWLGPTALPTLLVPSLAVHTIVTSRGRLTDFGTPVPLTGLSVEEAVQLLTSERTPSSASDKVAAEALAVALDGHPLALKAAARAMRDRDGLVSFSDYQERIRDRSGMEAVDAVVADRLRAIDTAALDVLRLATVLGPGPVPARLIARVLAGRHAWDGTDAGERAGATLETIADFCLADRSGAAWEVHRLVLDVVDRSFLDEPTRARLAGAAATAILELDNLDGDVVGHASALTGRTDLPIDDRLALMRLVASRQEAGGDVVAAAAQWERVVDLGPGNIGDLAAAAQAAYLAGSYEGAIGHGRRILQTRGSVASWRTHLLMARSFDRLGRYAVADRHWSVLAHVHDLPPNDRVELDVAQAGGLRMRGHIDDALAVLVAMPDLDASDDPGLELTVLIGRVERARLLLLKERVKEARTVIDEALRAYRSLGLTRHPDHLEAQAVWAEAATMMDALDFSWSNVRHQDGEARLRLIHDGHAQRLGHDHPLTVATAALLALAVMRGGRPARALDLLATAEGEILAWSEPNLPLLCRIGYIRGVAHLRLRFDREALKILGTTHANQLAMLGAFHTDTLDTQMELAVALMVTGDMAGARPLVQELGKAIPVVFGRRSSRYMRWVAVRAFAYLPRQANVAARQIDALIDAVGELVPGAHHLYFFRTRRD